MASEHDARVLDTGVSYVSLDLLGRSNGRLDALRRTFRRIRSLRRTLNALRPDIVIGLMTAVNVQTAVALTGRSTTLVLTEHNYPPRAPANRIWGALRWLVYRRADAVIALEQQGRDWLERHTLSRHVETIPNAICWPLPRQEPIEDPQRGWPGGVRRLLAVGRLVPQKGFDRLLNAFHAASSASEERWHLTILGDGPERTALEEAIEQLGLVDAVTLAGRVGNPGDWFEAADLFVLSSRHEGFPGVLLEAMASGCAVLAVDCLTGPAVIVRHDVDGVLVDNEDGALRDGLIRLMIDAPLRERLSTAAREVRYRFAEHRVLARWQSLFERLGVLPRLIGTHAVTFVVPSLDGGSAERATIQIANGFAAHGRYVELVVCGAVGPHSCEVHDTVRVTALDTPHVSRCVISLMRYLRRDRPAVIVSTASHIGTIVSLASWVSGSQGRTRQVIHETPPENGALKGMASRHLLLARRARQRVDDLVFTSRCQRDHFERTLDIGERVRLHVIPDPIVPDPDRQGLPTAERFDWHELIGGSVRRHGIDKITLGVGDLCMRNGFDTLIDAFARLDAGQRGELVILGEGKDRAALQERVERLGLIGSVHLPGSLPELFPAVRSTDLFVLSARREFSPDALLHAVALGTPVVATDSDHGDRVQILRGLGHGKLVPVDDAVALAAAIAERLYGPHQNTRAPADPQWPQTFSLASALERHLKICRPPDDVSA